MKLSRRPPLTFHLLPILLGAIAVGGADAAGNIDTLEPIVRLSPVVGSEDYFGYAVVLHQVEQPAVGNLSDALRVTRLIVGAPIGTYPGGVDGLPLSGVAVNETGLVYQCPVNPGNCQDVGGGIGDGIRLFDSEANLPDAQTVQGLAEQKSRQFMGATLYSSGDYFMACAPRYVTLGGNDNAFDSSRSVGRCFYAGQDLTDFLKLQPCVGGTPATQLDESYCMAGTGATIFQHPTQPDQTRLILGAPGVANSRGGLYLYPLNTTDIDDGVLTRKDNPVDISYGDDLYQGYALTTGTIFPGQNNVIAALPRFENKKLTGGVRIYDLSNVLTPVEVSPLGEQTGEYFGWAVATADLNGDGLDELIVGAPHYSTKTRVETGRAYVFTNDNGNLTSTPPKILEGDDVALSRFGSSVANIGDVNNDGYEDVAVGAPYQYLSDKANGTVFIYYGSPQDTIQSQPGQVIYASSVVDTMEGVTELKGFGFSLASKVDVDANEYYDLAVGAYASQHAILFRALSIADIEANVMANVEEVRVTEPACTLNNGSMFACFNLTVCASFTGKGLQGRELTTTLQLTENVEITDTKEQRVFFDNEGLSNTYTGPFIFPQDNEITCDNISVFIKNVDQIGDRLADFEMNAAFIQQLREVPTPVPADREVSDLRDFPIIRVTGNTTITLPVDTECGDVCYSDLVLEEPVVVYMSSTGSSNPENLVIGGVSNVEVTLTYYNDPHAEDAFLVELEFCLPSFLTYIRVLTSNVICAVSNVTICGDNGLTGTGYLCSPLQKLLEADGERYDITLVWRAQFSGNTLKGNELPFQVPLAIGIPNPDEGRSQENTTDRSNNKQTIPVIVVAVSNVRLSTITFSPEGATYTGANPADSGAQTLSAQDLGSKVDLRVGVVNGGPTDVEEVSLTIYMPTSSSATDDLYYIYPYEILGDTMGYQGSIDCSETFINPDNLTIEVAGGGKKRSVVNPLVWNHRRQVISERRRKRAAPAELNSNTVRRCAPPQEKDCVAIQCRLQNFPKDATYRVVISGVLDERFFSRSEDSFIFEAYAVVTIPEAYDYILDPDLSNNNATSNELRVSFRGTSDDDEVPWWVYFISIAGTLILIVVLFILLYFFGFFRRKKLEKPEAEGDFEPPPGTQAGGVTVTAITATGDDKPELHPGEEVKPEEKEKPVEEPEPSLDKQAEADEENGGFETEI